MRLPPGGLCFCGRLQHVAPGQRTSVYVDGFNLYYGAVRRTPYKWLNLRRLCELLLPQNDVTAIRYFTALVTGPPNDPTKPQRQQTFIRQAP